MDENTPSSGLQTPFCAADQLIHTLGNFLAENGVLIARNVTILMDRTDETNITTHNLTLKAQVLLTRNIVSFTEPFDYENNIAEMSSDAGMSSDFGFHLSEVANTDSQRTNDDLLVPGHQIRVNPSPDFQGPTFPMPLPLSWDQFTGGICRNLAGGFDVPQNSWPPVDLGTAHVGGSVEWPASSSPNSDGDRDKSSKAQTFIISAARSILRADYLEYLAAELPRWAKWGLYNIDNCTVDPNAEYYDLQLAYSTVCLLYTRMGDDEIRSRISLVKLNKEYLRAFETWQSRRRKRGIGRGDATCIIDNILQNIYHDWPTRNDRERKDLRTQFHSRKHFGKRWTMLSDVLGKGILLLCSPKVAKMVCNTAITSRMLVALVEQVCSHRGDDVRVLEKMQPIAESLYHGQVCNNRDVAGILDEVRKLGAAYGTN